MAAKRRRRRMEEDEYEQDERPRPRRRRSRFLRRLFVLLLLACAAVAAAPTIIANTPLRDTLLGWAMPDGRWGVKTGRAEFSWTGVQVLEGVELFDPAGKQLLMVGAVSLDRSLLALVTDQRDLGTLTVREPVLVVESRPGGSNVEDLLASVGANPPAAGAGASDSTLPVVVVEVVNGTVRGVDTVSQRTWTLNGGNATVKLGAEPVSLEATGNATLSLGENQPAGQAKFRVQQIAADQYQIDLLADRLPLEPLQPWLARALPGAWINGAASTDAQVLVATNSASGLQLQTTGRVETFDLSLQADALGGDRLQLGAVQAPWKLSLVGEEVHVEQLGLDADWARFQASGTFSLSELTALDLKNLPKRESKVSGQVQLEKLAAMLPKTLQLREGVWIDSGSLEFQAAGQPAQNGFTWRGAARVENVVGNDGRRAIRWTEPIEARIELVDSSQGPQLRELSFTAPFAEAKVATADERVNGNFQFDLQKLAAELGQFIDLGAWDFQGRGEGNLAIVPGTDRKFEALADVKLTELNIGESGKLVWTEPQLAIEVRATGDAVNLQPQQIATASLSLRGARDTFDLGLLEPVATANAWQPWKLRIEGKGPLASWAGRLRPWVAGVPDQLEGEAHLQAKLIAARDQVEILESSGSVTQLRVRHGAMAIDEPRVEFSGDARFSAATGDVASRELQLVSSTLAFRSRDVVWRPGGEGVPTATGTIAFRADLERVSSAAGLVGNRDASWLRGAAVGQLNLTTNSRNVEADFSADLQPLEIVRATATGTQPEVAWTESLLQTKGKLSYALAEDRLTMDQLALNGNTVRLSGSATVDKLRGDGQVQAGGMLQYDSAALAKLIATYLGPEFQVQGDRQVKFDLAGQLRDPGGAERHWSERWTVEADAGWTAASVFGLQVGQGQLQGRLRDGQLQIAPLDVTVGRGRLTSSPRAVLSPGPEQVVLPRGPLVTNVEISPQVSEAMLKYVAPMVAGATVAQGQFSVDLDSAQVPLAAPKQAYVQGRLHVHDLSVAPGPMIQQVAGLVRQIETLSKRDQLLQSMAAPQQTKALTMTDKVIDFQVSEGRVFHRNLEFLVDDVPVKSYGSVGFDQSLAIVLEVPIQQKWLGSERALQGLAGQMLQIPIHGTFQQPQIDQRALADLSQKLLQGAATQVIGDELNRALDRLFTPR